MAKTNAPTLDDLISQFVAGLNNELTILEAQKLTILGNLEANRAEIDRIKKLMRVAEGNGTKPKAKKSQRRGSMHSVEKLHKFLTEYDGAILEDIPGSFTIKEVALHTGLAGSTIKGMLESLNKQGIVRKAGSFRHPHAPRPSTVYAMRSNA